MMNRYSSFLIAAVGCLGAHAQITLTATDNVPAVPPPNSSFTYSKAAFAAAPAGGADQLFDYSTLVSTGTTTFAWTDTVPYSNGGLFTGAQMMSTNGTDTVFYELTDAGLERVGEFKRLVVFGNEVDLEISHSDNMLELALPLAFNDQWSDAVTGTLTSDGSSGDRNGIIQGVADGYGSLLLPGVTGAVPVLRVFTNLQEIIQVPIGGNPTDVAHRRKQYDYYAPFLKMPILSVYSDSLISFVNVVDNGIRWMNTNPVGVQELATVPMEIGLAPNPATDNVVMTLDLPTEAGAMLIISDATGRIIISERMPAGTRRWDLETHALATGCYSVTVLDRNGSHGAARLIKQ